MAAAVHVALMVPISAELFLRQRTPGLVATSRSAVNGEVPQRGFVETLVRPGRELASTRLTPNIIDPVELQVIDALAVQGFCA